MAESGKSLDQLLKEAFQLYFRHCLTFFNLTAIFYVPLWAIYFSLERNNYAPQLELMVALVTNKVSNSGPYLLTGIVTYAFTVFAVLLFQLASVRLCQSVVSGKTSSSWGAFREAWFSLSGYLAILLLVSCKIFCWSLLFFIPGIIFGTLYSLAPLACVIDGKKGNDALVFSRKIVEKNWFKMSIFSSVFLLVLIMLFFLGDVVFANVFGVNEPTELRIFPFIGEMFFSFWVLNLLLVSMLFFQLLYADLTGLFITKDSR